ncbi:hypothetical protein [Pseudomonas sp. P42]|uniref:hypothetical protein n=1 Tax=Pseudomonas sp. P42 TaxID=1080160 RepID=UPI003140AA86
MKGFIEKPLKRRAYERSHVPIQKRLRRAHRWSVTKLYHLAQGERSTVPIQRDVSGHVSAQSSPTNMAAPPPAYSAHGQTPDFQKARAHRGQYLARVAEMEFRKAQDELVEISFV